MKLGDISSPVLAADLNRIVQGTEIDAGQHDELGVDPSNIVADVKQAVSVPNDRRDADVEHGIKASFGHISRAPLSSEMCEPVEQTAHNLSRSLTSINATFVGLRTFGARLLPVFTLPRDWTHTVSQTGAEAHAPVASAPTQPPTMRGL